MGNTCLCCFCFECLFVYYYCVIFTLKLVSWHSSEIPFFFFLSCFYYHSNTIIIFYHFRHAFFASSWHHTVSSWCNQRGPSALFGNGECNEIYLFDFFYAISYEKKKINLRKFLVNKKIICFLNFFKNCRFKNFDDKKKA